jgi:putative phosphonate metabolism protein
LAADPRFAIYFVPAPDTALYRFGAAMLGYDCYTGKPVAHPRDIGLGETEWAALAAEPRTYGFHATLKAPFRLRGECDPDHLMADMRTMAAAIATVPTFAPSVALIGGFVAIVPRTPSPAVERLAADCVTALDRFRLPMTEAERVKRLAAGLGRSQTAHLDRWGYPYVLEEFRFHMTLTGRVEAERRHAVHTLLRDAFARHCGTDPIRLDRLALVRQEGPQARFRVVADAAVGQVSNPPTSS